MTKREKAQIQRIVDRQRAKVAKVRDELRDAISELESLLESVEGADATLDTLERAADEMSQYA